MKRLITTTLMWLTLAAAVSADVSVSIRFYDRALYHAGDPVQVEAMILNGTNQTYRFKLADRSVWSFDFEVQTPTLDRLAHSTEFTIDRGSNQPVFFREVSIEPGEQYGLILDLGRFVDLADPGVYTVRARFFPELARGDTPTALGSNTLMLNLRPRVDTPEERARVDTETALALRREPIPPDEVVRYVITARQQSQWDRFLLYMDLESLLKQDAERERRYTRSSEEERTRQLAQYRQDLVRERVDQDVLLRPASFQIERTSYTPSEAQVTVRSSFVYPDYTEWKRYTYRLANREGVWLVTAYEVRNLGTE